MYHIHLMPAKLGVVLGDLAAMTPEGDQKLGALLEVNPGVLIWTLVAFAVGLPLMWKFVYGPITKALEERDTKAELERARAEARRMVDEAVARAERQASEAARAADERAKVELQKARDAIAAEKRAALQEIRNHVVELTIQATGKLLHSDVDDAAHRRLVEGFVVGAGRGDAR